MNNRIVKFVGVGPTAVGVKADKLGSGVTVDDTINVDHGHYLENKVVE
jgi:hypothetical protein